MATADACGRWTRTGRALMTTEGKAIDAHRHGGDHGEEASSVVAVQQGIAQAPHLELRRHGLGQ